MKLITSLKIKQKYMQVEKLNGIYYNNENKTNVNVNEIVNDIENDYNIEFSQLNKINNIIYWILISVF